MQTLSHSQAHTQGPWSCVPGKFFIVYSYVDDEPIAVPKTEANAALIAAAPDMYAVLKELAGCSQYWSEYDVPLGIHDRIADALAKAVK